MQKYLEANSEVFETFAFYLGILALKLILMAPLTALHRGYKQVVCSPEDKVFFLRKSGKVAYDDPDIERVRRAHLNDLENILPFFIIGLLFCFTGPEVETAKLLFRFFTVARFVHTFVYAILPLPQPLRGVAWSVGLVINLYMSFGIIGHFI